MKVEEFFAVGNGTSTTGKSEPNKNQFSGGNGVGGHTTNFGMDATKLWSVDAVLDLLDQAYLGGVPFQ